MRALRFEETCPKCGSHLMVREGENGDFLACPRFPACKFTKPLGDKDLKIYQKPPPYCEKCNHTGLIPFVKEGKIIPNTFLYCECYEEPEHYQQASPGDFDFACSYAWRAYYEETIFGRYLPSLEPKEESIKSEQLEESWNKRQWDTIKQLKAQVLFLSDKVNKMRANASKRKAFDKEDSL